MSCVILTSKNLEVNVLYARLTTLCTAKNMNFPINYKCTEHKWCDWGDDEIKCADCRDDHMLWHCRNEDLRDCCSRCRRRREKEKEEQIRLNRQAGIEKRRKTLTAKKARAQLEGLYKSIEAAKQGRIPIYTVE